MSRFVLGNCIDVMARIPDNAIDFILPAPPYLVGFRDRQGAPSLAIKPMNGCNRPVMKCTAYSKKTR